VLGYCCREGLRGVDSWQNVPLGVVFTFIVGVKEFADQQRTACGICYVHVQRSDCQTCQPCSALPYTPGRQ
jgi:hypothetical protein